jgi:hypothetical protein
MGVLNINDAIKLGVRSHAISHPLSHDPIRTVQFKASLSGESLDQKYNQVRLLLAMNAGPSGNVQRADKL